MNNARCFSWPYVGESDYEKRLATLLKVIIEIIEPCEIRTDVSDD